MSAEIKILEKWNIDTIVMKKYKVFDQLGSTVFNLASGTWSVVSVADGTTILSGSVTVNNSDTDRAGNTIKTVSMTVDLRETDAFDLGSYFLVIQTQLDTQQTDIFRIAVELVDYRTVGVV